MSDIITPGRRILLVEDTLSDAILIERSIKQAFTDVYQIKRVETLTQAVKELADNIFDLVLLDLGLPDTSDFNGLLAVQATAPYAPIIMMTARADEMLALQAVELGAQDYLFKDKATPTDMKRSIQFAIQRKQFQNTLTLQANYDALTGLSNRTLYESRLDMALARDQRMGNGIGVLFLDLDGFKQVNDTLGHAAGDYLLKDVALRLKQSIRPYDVAARFGGDEFALLVEGIRRIEDCEMVAKKVISRVCEPLTIGKHPVTIGVSIGIATSLEAEHAGREDLLKQADAAMYKAKAAGGSNYHFMLPAGKVAH